MSRQTQVSSACGKAKKEIKMLSCVSVIFKASLSKRLLIILISLYIFTECLSFQHSQILDKKYPIYKLEKHLRSDLRALKKYDPYFYHYELTNVTFKRTVLKKVEGKTIYKFVHPKVPGLFVKYDCFSSICIDGGTVLISSWPSKFSQKTNLQTDVIAMIFLELSSTSGGGTNKLKKYLPVAVRLQSHPLKKKHRKIEWDIVSTKDRMFMNCSGFETFHSRPTSCKSLLPRTTRRLKLTPQQKQVPLVDDKRGHAHKRKYSLQIMDKKPSSSASEEAKQVPPPDTVSNESKLTSHVQFFRPLEIRLICPPFSGAIAENNKCICPPGKVNIMEKCVSIKKAKANGNSQSNFQSQISPIIPTKAIMDDSYSQDFVTIYICPDYSRTNLHDKKCICPNGQIMKKRVCSPNQEILTKSSIDRQKNTKNYNRKTSTLQQHSKTFGEINLKGKTRESKRKNLIKRY
ncbi:unnamed protein product [Orchesella dallaii]|uniref:Uncharacterized protein n=1 Tax=Orchesella dallaii TaxID=48710 RepID=A0ABP1RXA4_9HEXA